mmetsp:Transcript_47449/g.76462  ORF Transcript_47449/g.76462 Transcript_47449/m.76462 type:complete len:141 (-) Transcript_47449:129-551(-)
MQRSGTKLNVEGAHASRIRVHGCPDLISGALERERERVWIPETGISRRRPTQPSVAPTASTCAAACKACGGPLPLRPSSTQRWTPACIAGGWSIWRAGLVAARRGACTVFATTMMQPVQLLLDTVSDPATDSGRGDEFSD